ncbi:hypothetical protein BLNAU_10487 [Blattamonas nauphoetae]|uniref:Uncharacterized protein n=1 Tax=Blattamonas nauphoetae TaxID=2049346 RepID=A0ABQ9XQB8_9EUKA|nr:hypothetical protein BLNAU_10487 [Blattamonas nauphoetae]
MITEKVDKNTRIDAEDNPNETQHFTEAELDRYIGEKIEQILKTRRSTPTRSSSSSSLISESALSNVPFEEDYEASSTDEAPVRNVPNARKNRKVKTGKARGSGGKRAKREGSSPEARFSTPVLPRCFSPPTQSGPPTAWPPELAWLTQLIQTPVNHRMSPLSLFEDNESFRNEVGQYVRRSMRSWNGSFTDDVLEPRLRDTLIMGTAEMRKAVGIPSHVEFQFSNHEGWRRTQELALNGAVQSLLTSIAITTDVLRSLGSSPEEREKKEQMGQVIALLIDATTRADSSKYIDEGSEALYARSLGLPEPFIPQVQRQLQGEVQLAKLAISNPRSQPQVRNTPTQPSSSFFGKGGRSSTPGRESSSWRRLDTRPQHRQSHKQFIPRREGSNGQEGGKN